MAKAKRVGEAVRAGGRKVIVYDSGLELDAQTKRIAKPADGTVITAETSPQLHRARQEQKEAMLRQAANDAVERGDMRVSYGDMAYAAEIMQAAQRKATNIDDPKMIDAARFVFNETGLAEKKATDDQPQQTTEFMYALAGLVQFMTERLQPVNRDIIEGTISHENSTSQDKGA